MTDLNERLNLSASKMGLRFPFIMAATGRLPRIVDATIPGLTACTNGEWFKFGKEWVEKNVADDEELFGLDMHERMHVVWMHMWRRDGRDPAVWNIANDAIINANIIQMGYRLPKGGVHIDWVKPDMSSEYVYNKLMQDAEDPEDPDGEDGEDGPEDGQPCDDGQPGNKPGQGGKKVKSKTKHGKGGWDKQGDLEDAPNEASQADMEAHIRAAAQMARECGDQSELVNRILGATPKASVNWKDEVRAALTSSARDDFTYRKFSRRFIGRGMYMPTLHSDAIGGLLIGFDTSGSMSPADCNQVAGEIMGIVEDLSPDWVEVVYCDCVIKSTQRFERGDEIALSPMGGGGTAFKPVFDYADKLVEDGQKIAAMIYLTDMATNDLDELREPEFPVVFGNVYGADSAVPFGSHVRVIV